MLKKISTVIVALALVSCAQQPVDKDTAYLSYARSHATLQDSAFSDQILLDLAHASCKGLRAGKTMRELSDTIAKGSVSLAFKKEVAETVGYGVATYCPELQDNTLK